jgi:hypothetical protein
MIKTQTVKNISSIAVSWALLLPALFACSGDAAPDTDDPALDDTSSLSRSELDAEEPSTEAASGEGAEVVPSAFIGCSPSLQQCFDRVAEIKAIRGRQCHCAPNFAPCNTERLPVRLDCD